MTKKIIAPLITQVRTSYFSYDCGMAYIIRTGDGGFVMIDGNIGEYDEPDRLMELIDSQNETGEMPRISAWFLSHSHGDHIRGFVNFCNRFGERVRIENVIYSFPPKERYDEGADMTPFNAVIDALAERDGTRVITPKRGDRYCFADATFDVIFTYEDLGDEPIRSMNNASMVTLMELAGHRVMWLGDVERQASDVICANYSESELRCDIMQVGHHGYTGGSDQLYRAIDPEVLLWPCPDFWYHPGCVWKCNDYIAHSSKNIKATFVAGQMEAVLDLTKPIVAPTPYTYGKVSADIGKKSLCALHWTCLTGGGRGYAPVKLTFTEEGGCRLESGEAKSLCQMIQRGQTALSERYEFRIKGELMEGSETMGLIFDYTTPMEWKDEVLHTVNVTPGESFDLTLSLDRAARTATLSSEKGVLFAVSDICPEPADIILMMKNATVILTEVTFENLP